MEIDKDKLNKEALKKGIKMIVLFGSRAKGSCREDSDFDIAVLANKNIMDDSDFYNEILFFLSAALKIPDYKIDLTDIRTDNILLRYRIFLESRLIYGEKMLFHEYKSFAYREYLDANKLFDLEDKIIKKRQKLLARSLNQ